jgi:hypothetical protein
MDNGVSTSDLLRLLGFTGVCIGFAWALQVLGFSGDSSAFSRMMWILGAAAIAGAGVGAIYTATNLTDDEAPVRA